MWRVTFLIDEVTVIIGCVEEVVAEFVVGFVIDGGSEFVIVIACFGMKVYIVFFVFFLTWFWEWFFVSDEGLVSLERFGFSVEAEAGLGLLVTHRIIQIEFITVCCNLIIMQYQYYYYIVSLNLIKLRGFLLHSDNSSNAGLYLNLRKLLLIFDTQERMLYTI